MVALVEPEVEVMVSPRCGFGSPVRRTGHPVFDKVPEDLRLAHRWCRGPADELGQGLGDSADEAAVTAAAKAVLRSCHARVHVVGTNIVGHSERLAVEITDLQALVTPGSTDESDLAPASGLLAGVSASAFAATTDGATTVRAAQHAVAQAQALVDQVTADVAAG
jgi:hypothetical protein